MSSLRSRIVAGFFAAASLVSGQTFAQSKPTESAILKLRTAMDYACKPHAKSFYDAAGGDGPVAITDDPLVYEKAHNLVACLKKEGANPPPGVENLAKKHKQPSP